MKKINPSITISFFADVSALSRHFVSAVHMKENLIS